MRIDSIEVTLSKEQCHVYLHVAGQRVRLYQKYINIGNYPIIEDIVNKKEQRLLWSKDDFYGSLAELFLKVQEKDKVHITYIDRQRAQKKQEVRDDEFLKSLKEEDLPF